MGGKWKLKILCSLHYRGTLRYSELKRLVVGVSPTMLASSLRELEEDGLVVRTMHDTMPVKVEYCLSEASESLVPILCKLRDWAVAYRPELYTTASKWRLWEIALLGASAETSRDDAGFHPCRPNSNSRLSPRTPRVSRSGVFDYNLPGLIHGERLWHD
ncbi:winged helix-turn-helix transcriptional regulator [Slackia heliotrinireducens]|uniref:winged helix-turn-helix transcriptional regulator n=1 Tax=Slackia heliotrinireducens TaxID=84110 RepID=UPI0033152F6A